MGLLEWKGVADRPEDEARRAEVPVKSEGLLAGRAEPPARDVGRLDAGSRLSLPPTQVRTGRDVRGVASQECPEGPEGTGVPRVGAREGLR